MYTHITHRHTHNTRYMCVYHNFVIEQTTDFCSCTDAIRYADVWWL